MSHSTLNCATRSAKTTPVGGGSVVADVLDEVGAALEDVLEDVVEDALEDAPEDALVDVVVVTEGAVVPVS
jgi:hypothetical protein